MGLCRDVRSDMIVPVTRGGGAYYYMNMIEFLPLPKHWTMLFPQNKTLAPSCGLFSRAGGRIIKKEKKRGERGERLNVLCIDGLHTQRPFTRAAQRVRTRIAAVMSVTPKSSLSSTHTRCSPQPHTMVEIVMHTSHS